jgi:hypothetical protein
LKPLLEAVHREDKSWTLSQRLDSPSWQNSNSQAVKQLLARKSITEMKHPPYSTHLTPNDFWLFPKIKSTLKGRRFRDDIQKMWQQDFQKCFQQWQHHWTKSIAIQRGNFEGDFSPWSVRIQVCLQ